MYGFAVVCLFLISTVSAQLGYEGRPGRRLPGIGGIDIIRDDHWGRERRPGGIIGGVTGGIIDRTRDLIGNNFFGDDCYPNEVPSFWDGRIDTCSYINRQCYDRRAICRINHGQRGTCCEPRRRRNRRNRCYDGSRGLGSCNRDRQCRRQFGRSYECQFRRGSARRGNNGRCCSRYSQGILH